VECSVLNILPAWVHAVKERARLLVEEVVHVRHRADGGEADDVQDGQRAGDPELVDVRPVAGQALAVAAQVEIERKV